MRRIMSLWVTYEDIVDFQISFTISGVSYALKWVTTSLECYYALLDSGAMVFWSWRAKGSLYRMAFLHCLNDASLRPEWEV